MQAALFRHRLWNKTFTAAGSAILSVLALAPAFTVSTALAQGAITTPVAIPELPIEVETEVGPAGSLKKVPLWKEIVELLDNPYAMECPEDDPATNNFDESSECVATTERRPGFGTVMPPLNVFNPCFNVLTGQPLRTQPSGEIDWNQPGPLFDPDEVVDVGPGNVPTELRTTIGFVEANDDGELVVINFDNDDRIPPTGTVIAEPACNEAGLLVEDGEVVEELEKPVNENNFIRNRLMAEVLGKALFWDMQVGSDSVQACGSCHFNAGVDDRTRNQLNPNTTGGNLDLDVRGAGTPQSTNAIDVVAADFPFHRLADPDIVGEPNLNPGNVVSDSNDVMSSMGVSRFARFDDVIVPRPGGPSPFGPAPAGHATVVPLMPDLGTPMPDPVPVNQGSRRIEPRNTPTFHSAAFNFDNFWDGRARHDFNGGSVFGPSDPFFHVYVNCDGELRPLAAPAEAEGPLCGWTLQGGNTMEPGEAVPVRIRFSSLASQAMGPPLSNTEMAFDGRNWAKFGKKLLQPRVTPLAKQLVDPTDSRLGMFSNQGGAGCAALPAASRSPGWTAPGVAGRPGLCINYPALIQAAFYPDLWSNTTTQRLNGTAVDMDNECEPGEQIEVGETPTCDPFDGYVLTISAGAASPMNTNQFSQIQANFSLFFGLAVQVYEQLTLPDDTPWDRFNDVNPMLGNGVAQPGENGTLLPEVIRELVTGAPDGRLNLVPGVGPDEIFGFDIFAGGNITAALAPDQAVDPVSGVNRNPAGVGSNPFLRTARCMLCHLGPEQSDHTNNVNAGLLQSGTEVEFPTPQTAPEPTGVLRVVTGFSLAEELEENAQDGVEVENRNFAILDDPSTPWDDRQIGVASAIAFQDNGVYNIGLRPTNEDIMRGGDDPFEWPLALSALALKNLGGPDFEPCDTETEAAANPASCLMTNFDPSQGPSGGLFEEVGEGFPFEGTNYEEASINPGFEMEPANPRLPEYLADWANNLPAGELSPLIDELAFAPNTVTAPPSAEYGEILFGADLHCGVFDPAAFGNESPNFGWGPNCPNSQTGVPVNFDPPLNGTWPFPNRVARNGAVKVPQLRNVELTGPYFHTGSYLTLRQIVDFYMRGGDFPMTNSEDRDPNLVEVNTQAFGFGTTQGLPVQFQDGVPDAVSQYGTMPDTDHDTWPEPATSTPAAAKEALVKFMLALTDERVAHRAAPFDQPEIFVPIDGIAPENAGGRAQLLTLSANGAACTPTSVGQCFLRVPPTGAAGQPQRVNSFLNIARTPQPGPNNDHFDR